MTAWFSLIIATRPADRVQRKSKCIFSSWSQSVGKEPRYQSVFVSLKCILGKYSGELVLVKNQADDYYLDTNFIMKNRKPMFFGAVQVKKNYVAYHLMPVYVFPELLSGISPRLRRRMQGKSCFNFKAADQALFHELEQLTAAGYQRYKEANYI